MDGGDDRYAPSNYALMSKKEPNKFMDSIFDNPLSNQDLQDQILGRNGFRPGAPPREGATAPPGPGTGLPGIFQFGIEVLLSPTRASRPMLSIAIDYELTQIWLKFDLTDSDKSIRPTVCGIVDSCISLCTGNLNFFTDSYKAFPCIVEGIVIAKSDNFALISLSSIVREDNKEVTTTELHILYILHMPYT